MRRFVVGWRKVAGMESPHAAQMQSLLDALADAGETVAWRPAPSELVRVYQGKELLIEVQYRSAPPDPAAELAPGGALATDTLDAAVAAKAAARQQAAARRKRWREIGRGEGDPITEAETTALLRALARRLAEEA